MYQALYRKWRPLKFSDVAGQEHITDVLRSQAASGGLSHAYLFTGSRGTGKTSCAKILARAACCEDLLDGNPCGVCPACEGILDGSVTDVLELDAASNRGIDNIRALRDEWAYTPAVLKKRVYIIDEVHMLTNESFNALLKTLEEPPSYLLFVLATTEPHKVPATIASRCQCFSFRRLSADVITARLNFVAQAESITLSPDAARLISAASDGAMRDALSLLDQCASGGAEVDLERACSVLGLTGGNELRDLAMAMASGDLGGCLTLFGTIYAQGRSPVSLLDELCGLFRDLLVGSVSFEPVSRLSADDISKLQHAFGGQRRILYCAGRVQDTLSRLSRSANRRIDTELCLAELCDASLPLSFQSLAARIERLEKNRATAPAEPVPEPETPKPAPAQTYDDPVRAQPAIKEPAAEPDDIEDPNAGPPQVWPDALDALKTRLQRSVYSHLAISVPKHCGNTLFLTCDSDMAAALLSQNADKIEDVLKTLGLVVSVRVKCEDEAKPESKLDAFINGAKGNITVK